MTYLFLASFLLIVYGTLFPFTFQADASELGLLAALIDSLAHPPGRGDSISNIVLFLPFGFLGMQALPARIPTAVRLMLVGVLGLATSLGIEVAQHYLTMRTTSLYDLGLNAISALLGAIVGSANWQRWTQGAGRLGARPKSIYPVVMIAAWAAYRLFPYVPTLDFQNLKDALKPLLAMSPFSLADTFRHFAIVLALALLLRAVLPQAKTGVALLLLALSVIAVKPFILLKVIWPAEVIGTVAALVLWFAVLSRAQSNTLIVALLFAIALACQGLTPFELRPQPASFSFIPFNGFVHGSMVINFLSLMEKVFLYGTLLWLLVQAGANARFSLSLVALLTLCLEIAQRYIVGRSAEITDPILALLVGSALLLLDRHFRGGPVSTASLTQQRRQVT